MDLVAVNLFLEAILAVLRLFNPNKINHVEFPYFRKVFPSSYLAYYNSDTASKPESAFLYTPIIQNFLSIRPAFTNKFHRITTQEVY